MERVIVAFERETTRTRMKEMLESDGIVVPTACRSGAEVIRAAKKLGGAVVVCGDKLGDMTADQLAHNLRGVALVLAVGPASRMAFFKNEDLFKLPAPVSRTDLLASVRMLLRLQGRSLRMRAPRRSGEETAIIQRAKEFLMSKNCMTEEEAHRFLQKKSMDNSMKMVDTARAILGID